MKPVDFPQANVTFTRPPSMTDAECSPLRVHATGEQLVSCWQPTDEEREALAAGAPLWFWIFGSGHPPVSLEVASPFSNEPLPRRTLPDLAAAFVERLRRGDAAPTTVAYAERAFAEVISRYLGIVTRPTEAERIFDVLLVKEAELADAQRQAASWREGCGRWNDAAKDLAAALLEAMNAVHVFHGPPAWPLYRDHSPEMRRWRALLEKVGVEIPAHLRAGGCAAPPREEAHRG